MAKILILGGGFAGITAVEMLSKAADPQHEITVVSASDHFTFYPALVPMVFGLYEPQDIRFELRPKLASRNVRFVRGDVTGIDPQSRTATVTGDDFEGSMHFDLLLVAMGRRLATEHVPGFFENAHHLLGVTPALRFREAIASFDRGAIVLGACMGSALPIPVCEAALGLAKKFETEIKKGIVTVSAVFPTTLEKAFEGTSLFRDIESEFERNNIALIQDFPIARVTDKTIVSALGSEIRYDLLMLVPPFHGQTPVAQLSAGEDDSGYADVNHHLQLWGTEGIYAAGDIVSLAGPRFGYMAIRQAKVAALNILQELSGEAATEKYVHELEWILGEKYTDPILFHYGFWDETLSDFDDEAFFGMARHVRDKYGKVRTANQDL
jgi:sulfide:quinone oxidoreductase